MQFSNKSKILKEEDMSHKWVQAIIRAIRGLQRVLKTMPTILNSKMSKTAQAKNPKILN